MNLPVRCGTIASLVCTLVCGALVAPAVQVAGAQVPANEQWKTIATPHFRLHFTRPLEAQARHAASVAERAYANLASELVKPRGPIDIVLSDGTDASNGSATVIPRPTIIMYARPPVDEPSLESYDDWTVLVLQHELTHIFHLDRSRGWWATAQSVFGRNPVLFPNNYTPSWLTEGLAVYYESRFTSGGRLHGSFESAIAQSAARDDAVPRLSELSLSTSRFPYGQSVYVYGSFLWDDLARAHGAASVPAYVERSSAEMIPFLLDREAKRTFGETFTHAWRHWRDSTTRAAADSASRASAVVLRASRAVVATDAGRYVIEPRWTDDSTLIFAANNGRSTPGLYRVRLGAAPVRLARRNSLDTNDPSPNGSVVFAQGEYIDRFHTRGDLYMSVAGGEQRLTHDARLSEPSVRGDGTVVAVQTVPASTRLVLVTHAGRSIEPLTHTALDTQWTAPRWSPDGKRIAAIRIAGALNELVLLDDTGRIDGTLVREDAVLRSPAWTPDGRAILYTSDRDGIAQLFSVRADGGDAAPQRLTAERGGVYGADAVAFGADSVRIATTALRGDGYHVLVWSAAARDLQRAGTAEPRADRDAVVQSPVDPRWKVTDDTTRARSYSPWRTLIPAYWSPTFAQEGAGRGNLAGVLTSASDPVGRHTYIAQASVNLRNSNVDASLWYAYNRWINPMLTASLEQSWSYGDITSGGARVGYLNERNRLASLRATFSRPRVRTYSAVTVGTEFEQRDYSSDPASLFPRLNPYYQRTHRYPTLLAAAVFSNTQRPGLSISPEDGVVLSAALRQRWEDGTGAAGRSAVAAGTAYKSLDLRGFAHHVLAVRAAIGSADRRSPSEFDVGGVSGTSVEVVPGINFGSAARTFPVRGFGAGDETGVGAAAMSAEYRIPLAAPSRAPGLFPLFLDRASLTVFGDAARAWCPAAAVPACSPASVDGPTLASVGAELNLDTALQFDVPYRFRVGLAHPVHGRSYAGASAVTAYATLGLAF